MLRTAEHLARPGGDALPGRVTPADRSDRDYNRHVVSTTTLTSGVPLAQRGAHVEPLGGRAVAEHQVEEHYVGAQPRRLRGRLLDVGGLAGPAELLVAPGQRAGETAAERSSLLFALFDKCLAILVTVGSRDKSHVITPGPHIFLAPIAT